MEVFLAHDTQNLKINHFRQIYSRMTAWRCGLCAPTATRALSRERERTSLLTHTPRCPPRAGSPVFVILIMMYGSVHVRRVHSAHIRYPESLDAGARPPPCGYSLQCDSADTSDSRGRSLDPALPVGGGPIRPHLSFLAFRMRRSWAGCNLDPSSRRPSGRDSLREARPG